MIDTPSRCLVALGVGTLLVASLSCGADKPSPPTGLTEPQVAGWQAYVQLDCGSCHGAQREGKRSGPALVGLSELWRQNDLVVYLQDPEPVVKSTPRLAYRAEQYAITMPKYEDRADEATLTSLASYLLVDPNQH